MNPPHPIPNQNLPPPPSTITNQNPHPLKMKERGGSRDLPIKPKEKGDEAGGRARVGRWGGGRCTARKGIGWIMREGEVRIGVSLRVSS